MRDRARDDEEKSCSGRERSGEPASGHESGNPVRKPCNLGVGQHDDVSVDRQLIRNVRGGAGILNEPISILVFELDQPGGLPIRKPGRHFSIGRVGDGRQKVRPSEGCHRWSGRVEQCNEQKRPSGRASRLPNFGYGVKPDNDVRQSCRPCHQRRGDKENVQRAFLSVGVSCKSQLPPETIEAVEKVDPGSIVEHPAETELGNRVSREKQ